MSDTTGTLRVRIRRGGATGSLVTYDVPERPNQTVLDVVTEIQRRQEPSLAYRFACRVGVCGSCAMTVNGKPRWTCRTHVRRVADGGEITIEPLRNLPIIKDLVVDMEEFFNKWQRAGGVFLGKTDRTHRPAHIDTESEKRRRVDEAIECINCAVCYAACDVVHWDKDYLGPAALNRAWTLVNDERHADVPGVFRKATGAGGCGSCHTHGSCMSHCPINLSPTASIAGMKRRSLFDLFGKA
ncbi:MAG: succinate dehydrogenase/fumarate reductase iron-sulfur subunit [Ectothiorhodospiraceae bacterium]|nr:succinate dehydrogenase/fumarate reductase iron-sulfur subunit [Ectothiorhodospiraceae bacterium]